MGKHIAFLTIPAAGHINPTLRRTVEDVAADPAIRTNLAAMVEHIRGAGGPVAAADALEAYSSDAAEDVE